MNNSHDHATNRRRSMVSTLPVRAMSHGARHAATTIGVSLSSTHAGYRMRLGRKLRQAYRSTGDPYPDFKGEPYHAPFNMPTATHPGMTPAANQRPRSIEKRDRVRCRTASHIKMAAGTAASGTRFGRVR